MQDQRNRRQRRSAKETEGSGKNKRNDGSVARLKARLVSKGYAQTYGIDYSNTFSPLAKLTSIRLFISLIASYAWDLHHLDIKNVFLRGNLQEEVYMEQPSGFVA